MHTQHPAFKAWHLYMQACLPKLERDLLTNSRIYEVDGAENAVTLLLSAKPKPSPTKTPTSQQASSSNSILSIFYLG